MTATVESTMTLPAQSHQAGAPIVESDGNQGGVKQLARAINTIYEQTRVVLVNQIGASAGTPSSIINNTGETAYWRVKNLGYSGGENTADVVDVWALVTLTESASGSATLRVLNTESGNSVTYSYSSNVSETWVEIGSGLAVDDDTEYYTFELEFTAASNMSIIQVYGLSIYYNTDNTSLTAGAYSQNGYHPLHDEHFDDNSPMSAHLLHHMHRNVESLYQYRQGGNLIATGYGPDNVQGVSTTNGAPVWVPRGVEQIKVWVYHNGHPGGGATGTLYLMTATLTAGTTQVDSETVFSSTTLALATWDTVTFDVGEYQEQWLFLAVANNGNGPTYESVCAYTVNAVRL